MGREELEEGRKRERKVWEREKYKTSERQKQEAGGFPRRALAGPDAENNGPHEAGEPEGKAEGDHIVRPGRSLCFRSQGHGSVWAGTA